MHILREYQSQAVESVFKEWEEHRSTLVVAPTGCGKTQMFCEIIRRMLPRRAMVIAHREELIFQARHRLRDVCGVDGEIEMGELHALTDRLWRAPVIISTVQTQNAPWGVHKRMARFKPDDFGLLVIDEAHHAVADSYRNLIGYYRQNENLKVLGVTATPDRADEEALGQVFDSVAFDYEILDAIHGGWLVPVDQQFVHVDSLDFSRVRTTAGDLNGADLAQVMEEENNMQGVAGASLPIIGTRRSIVFTASVRQAEMLCNIYNRHRSGMAEWVCGTTPKEVRRIMLGRFADGTLQVVVNCGVLTEGFDNPAVEVIVMARPTKSRSLYAQMAGRSLRPLPGVVESEPDANNRRGLIASSPKPSALILDFVGNSGRHKLITSADILGGKVSDAALERALKKAKESEEPTRMDEALDQAEAELHEMIENARLRAEAQKAKVVAQVKYTQNFVDPFGVFALIPVRQRGWDQGRQLSPKQKAVLVKQGINPEGLPYEQGRQLLLEVFRRWDNKLCSFKQANVLKKYARVIGRDPKDKALVNVSREEASQLIDKIAALQNWRPRPRPQKRVPAAAPF